MSGLASPNLFSARFFPAYLRGILAVPRRYNAPYYVYNIYRRPERLGRPGGMRWFLPKDKL